MRSSRDEERHIALIDATYIAEESIGTDVSFNFRRRYESLEIRVS